jgi:hypothetical protein
MTPHMRAHHWPWTFLFFSALGVLTLLAGIAAFVGLFANVHPLLADEMAGWGLIASAIACFLSGAFPLALRRLAEREGA